VKVGKPLLLKRLSKCMNPLSFRGRGGFSLIEVALALGIVSFALIPVMSMLPVGLATIQGSMNQTVTTSIAQQLRGELQEASFSSLQTLTTTPYYYTVEGIATVSSDPNAYYKVTFAVSNTTIPGGGSFDNTNAAQTVTVTANYPQSAPTTSQKSSVFSFLVAKQGTN
jgi:uncharacterized protein (TIGR02598 family)